MSYRHRSYRKLRAAISKAREQQAATGRPDLSRPELARVMHWSNAASPPKPDSWGRPA